jgi:anti-sigma-K factor RskA
VNIKEYIESGVLELYIYDQLSDADRAEVEEMSFKYPEIKAELDAVQDAIDGYAKSHAHIPDPALRDKILSKLTLIDAVEPKVVPMKPAVGSANTYRWLAAASVALFVVSGSMNLYLYDKYQNLSGQMAELQSKNNVMADNNIHLTKQIEAVTGDLTTVSDPANVRVQLAGLPLSPTARALIFWDKERKSTYINTADLPPLAMEKQYQLWAIVDGKPVDLGVLPIDKQQTALVKVKDVSAPQAFAITIEPKGGSVNPTMDQMIVLGKL